MWIDIGFVVFLAYGFYIGYSRGFIKTLYAVLSLIIALLLSFKLSPFFVEFIESTLKLGTTISFILGFIICFLVIIFIVRLIGRIFEKTLKAVKLNFINKIAGGMVFALVLVFFYGYILWFLNQTNVLNEKQKEQSISYIYLEPIPRTMKGAFEQLKPAFKGFWEKSTEAINESKNIEDPPDNEIIQK
ncbi:CvpA family protein [Portibacter marinus]|uniref:CvpA family protein n=1 Tax=Portibacter marinus TaxID=2898660 RepID=UPI001F2EE9EA|nr:CvpA family protein [Portibacter marinus]